MISQFLLFEFQQNPLAPGYQALLSLHADRVRTGHGKPGKSWNLRISFFRPGKSSNLIVGPWKMLVLFDRLVTADDKARTT